MSNLNQKGTMDKTLRKIRSDETEAALQLLEKCITQRCNDSHNQSCRKTIPNEIEMMSQESLESKMMSQESLESKMMSQESLESNMSQESYLESKMMSQESLELKMMSQESKMSQGCSELQMEFSSQGSDTHMMDSFNLSEDPVTPTTSKSSVTDPLATATWRKKKNATRAKKQKANFVQQRLLQKKGKVILQQAALEKREKAVLARGQAAVMQ